MNSLKFLSGVFALALAFSAGVARAEPVKIRVAWVTPVANRASILFERPGLARHMGKSYTFEAVRFQGAPPMLAAMANGELEIADLAFSSFALAVQSSGMNDLRVIADEFQGGVEGYYSDEFFVLKDSPVRSIRDLKGKVLATNAAGSAVDIVMRAALRKNRLDAKKDVSFVEAALPNMKAMLLEKKVELIPGVVPFSLDPELRRATRVLFTQKQIVGRTQIIVWAAREDFIKKNRAALVDFMEDALRATRWGSSQEPQGSGRDRGESEQAAAPVVREMAVRERRPEGRLLPRSEPPSESWGFASQYQAAEGTRFPERRRRCE